MMQKTKKRSFLKQLRRDGGNYVLLAPALLYTIIFGYATYPYMAVAFEKFDYRTGIFSQFTGLKNFEAFFKSTWAWLVTRNTVVLNLLFIVTGTLVAVAVALMLNEITHKKYLKVVQSTMLFPYFISWAVVAMILYALLSTETGLINAMRNGLGLKSLTFYSKDSYWPTILVLMRIWKGVGYSSIIYLATITGMDAEIYEAAAIDGANRWQMAWKITIPMLMPTVCILMLMDVGRAFFGDFTMIYSIIGDNGMLLKTTDVIDTYIYRALRKTGDISISMAVGVYQSLVGFILVFTVNRIVKKYYPDGALF